MRTIFASVAGLSAAFLIACGPPPKGAGDDDGGDGGTGAVDADTTDGDFTPVDGMTCGAQQSNIGVMNLGDPPDLLVVLDRSGSMISIPFSIPPVFVSKWDSMKNALKTTVMAKQTQIKFGLLEFPSDNNCAATAVPDVGIALNTYPGFNTYFNTNSPDGNTPAHLALGGALTYYNQIPVNPAGRYVLFATDGVPNCLNGDPNTGSGPATVAAVTSLRNAGIKTYVLGFGEFGGGDILNDAAIAGGVPQAGATKYYQVNNQAQLDAALNAIAGGIIVPTCSFALQSVPPDPNNVTVTINGTPVPRSPSHANGWDYHPNAMTITFFGSYCDQIMMGASSSVSFVYGCPGPVIN
jgi:hypothetical protein